MSSKVFEKDGRLWYEEVTPGNYHIGLTDEILSRVRNECWSIIPNVGNIKKGQPLFAIETNDELLSILSPFTGRVLDVEFAAQNSPEKLTSATRIVTFGTGARKVAPPPPPVQPEAVPMPRAAVRPRANRLEQPFGQINWGQLEQGIVADQARQELLRRANEIRARADRDAMWIDDAPQQNPDEEEGF